jgi:hypothetical protein
MSDVTRHRTARKLHRCDSCLGQIPDGDVYLERVSFRSDVNDGPAPSRFRECARCAKRYGREFALGDVPYEQLCRDGLL